MGVDRGETVAKAKKSVGVTEIAALVPKAAAQPVQGLVIVRRQEFTDLLTEAFGVEIVYRDTHESESVG